MSGIDVMMNEKRLALGLRGDIVGATVQELIRELDYGFDYYKFPAITVSLSSPGGEYTAMRALLDTFKTRRSNNFQINVHASQMCASAAALVLAHGTWGTRTVEIGTHLQFHWARAMVQVGQVLTSDIAATLARGLSTLDKKVIDQLVVSMSDGAGSNRALVQTMSARLDELLDNWDELARVLRLGVDPRPAKKVTWVKDLQRNVKRWAAESDESKRTEAIVASLNARFELDSVMDLREAYALCLIDVVRGVLPMQKPPVIQGIQKARLNAVSPENTNDHGCQSKLQGTNGDQSLVGFELQPSQCAITSSEVDQPKSQKYSERSEV
jgi:ATP-dependent protease ClpP protease subunit